MVAIASCVGVLLVASFAATVYNGSTQQEGTRTRQVGIWQHDKADAYRHVTWRIRGMGEKFGALNEKDA